MKLLAVPLARVSWLFDTSLMNPKGISLHEVFTKLTERYRFSKAPKHPLDMNEQRAIQFQVGTFLNSKKLPIGVGLTIYSDGMVVDTLSSTDDCKEFFQDIVSWLTENFGLVIPALSEVKQGYVSHVEVESNISLEALTPKLTSFVRALQSRVKPLDGKTRSFEVAGIGCWTEDVLAAGAPDGFRFERKYGAPFASNRYFSTAPLETKEHLRVLEEFETIFRPQ